MLTLTWPLHVVHITTFFHVRLCSWKKECSIWYHHSTVKTFFIIDKIALRFKFIHTLAENDQITCTISFLKIKIMKWKKEKKPWTLPNPPYHPNPNQSTTMMTFPPNNHSLSSTTHNPTLNLLNSNPPPWPFESHAFSPETLNHWNSKSSNWTPTHYVTISTSCTEFKLKSFFIGLQPN